MDLHIRHRRYNADLFLGVLDEDIPHTAARCGERHVDLDGALPVAERFHVAAVDEPEVDDVDRAAAELRKASAEPGDFLLAIGGGADRRGELGIDVADANAVCYGNALAAYAASGQIAESDWLEPAAIDQRTLYEGNSILRGGREPRIEEAKLKRMPPEKALPRQRLGSSAAGFRLRRHRSG